MCVTVKERRGEGGSDEWVKDLESLPLLSQAVRVCVVFLLLL